MPEVTCNSEITASADTVWELLGDFNGLAQWMGAIATSTLEGSGLGALRTLTLADGGVIVEKLESHDDDARTFSYSIVSGPLPVADYLSSMTVTALDDGRCTVKWTGSCTAAGASDEEVEGILDGIYSGGLQDLCDYLGSRSV